jgi:hypothetical protein
MNPVKPSNADLKASRRNIMKTMVHLVLTLSLVVILANCGAAREQIRTQSLSEGEGVFQVVTTTDGPPPGFADVVVKASLKTHLFGAGPLLESRNSPHGGPFYHFTVDINGQGVTWEVPGQRENLPVENGRHFPEEGEGTRYVLEKKIRLHSGAYSISFGVPEENYTDTMTVNLQEGKSYTLKLQPIYPRYKWGHPASQLGLLGFKAAFNNTANN